MGQQAKTGKHDNGKLAGNASLPSWQRGSRKPTSRKSDGILCDSTPSHSPSLTVNIACHGRRSPRLWRTSTNAREVSTDNGQTLAYVQEGAISYLPAAGRVVASQGGCIARAPGGEGLEGD